MAGAKRKLHTKTEKANCFGDIKPILKHLKLSDLKAILKQQLEQMDDKTASSLLFQSSSIIDIYGSDVIRKCLSYLTINELYKCKIICKTFENINTAYLRSDEILNDYLRYNPKLKKFQDFLKNGNVDLKYTPGIDAFCASSEGKLAIFHLSEDYGHYVSMNKLKGIDLVIANCIKNLGFNITKVRSIARCCWFSGDKDHIILNVKDDETIYKDNWPYKKIQTGIGYIDNDGSTEGLSEAGSCAMIQGNYEPWEETLYHAFYVDTSARINHTMDAKKPHSRKRKLNELDNDYGPKNKRRKLTKKEMKNNGDRASRISVSIHECELVLMKSKGGGIGVSCDRCRKKIRKGCYLYACDGEEACDYDICYQCGSKYAI